MSRTLAAIGLLAAAIVALVALSQSTPASAVGFTVNVTTDAVDANTVDGVCDSDLGTEGLQCTLRAAVQQANADVGADVINLSTGTYTLTIPGLEDASAAGDLDISDSVTIDGTGEGNTTIQASATPGFGIDRVFHISTGLTVALSDLTIRHGTTTARGGGIWNSGLLTIDAVTLHRNEAQDGGGIFNESGSLDATGSTFSENEAVSDGGGLYNESGPTTLQDVDVTDNLSGSNGAGLNSEGTGATLLVSDSTINGNIVDTCCNGGGIDAEGSDGTLTVVNSTIVGNQVGSNGGGIYVFAGTSFTMFGSTVAGNTAGSNGGGLFYNGNEISITDSAITGNGASAFGGGVYSWSDASLINLTISGNTAGGSGGGIFVRAVTTILNSTIVENAADFDGNGTGDGGGVYVQTGTDQVAILDSAIVALNTDPASDPDCWGQIDSDGYNLVQIVSAGCDISGDTGSNITGQDPLIGPLTVNGGPTLTHPLLPGSPAIDAATTGCPPPSGDQRGIERPQGPECDIGAFELEGGGVTASPTLPPPSATATPASTPTPSPTATTTATPAQTVTPTPTTSESPSPTGSTGVLWGNSDCDDEITTRDNQALLREVLQQTALSQTEPCPDLGAVIPGDPERVWGDWDCDGAVTTRDNQALLRHVLQQTALSQTEPCPDIGTQAT